MNWNKVKLSEVTTILGDGLHGTPTYDPNGEYYFINGSNLLNGKIVTSDKDKKVSYQEYLKHKKNLNDRTILVSINGTLGNVAIYNNEKIILGKSACYFNVKENIDKLFIKYVISSPFFKAYIHNLSTGTTIKNVSLKLMRDFEFYLPNLHIQKKISNILGTLDNKIDLNTQINQTLEQIAQALFKSWFVDFDPVRAKVQALSDGLSLEQAELAAMQAISGKTPEELTALSQTQPERYAELAETAKAFPCEMVEVDGVEVPKGWELSTIGDCYDVVMGQSPKGETYNENKQGMLFYQGRAEFGWRFPTPRLFTTDPKRIAEQNSILMSVRAPVGDINIALEKCCIGRGLAALQHKSKSLSFGLYQIQSIKSELDLFNGEGTIFGSINQANLKNIQIINPDEKFIQLFEKYLSSCDSKIMNNEIENNALKEIRDLLLPRLLSGKIEND